MDTSSNDNNTNINRMELEILIIASIQSLKRNNKKCGNEEVFEIVLESLDNPIDRSYFDETIETLIQNKKVKMICHYPNNLKEILKIMKLIILEGMIFTVSKTLC